MNGLRIPEPLPPIPLQRRNTLQERIAAEEARQQNIRRNQLMQSQEQRLSDRASAEQLEREIEFAERIFGRVKTQAEWDRAREYTISVYPEVERFIPEEIDQDFLSILREPEKPEKAERVWYYNPKTGRKGQFKEGKAPPDWERGVPVSKPAGETPLARAKFTEAKRKRLSNLVLKLYGYSDWFGMEEGTANKVAAALDAAAEYHSKGMSIEKAARKAFEDQQVQDPLRIR